MPNYTDRNGDSGVASYELIDNGIEVTFKGGSVYTYTTASTTPENIAEMIRLANAGDGLNSFISTIVKDGYEGKS